MGGDDSSAQSIFSQSTTFELHNASQSELGSNASVRLQNGSPGEMSDRLQPLEDEAFFRLFGILDGRKLIYRFAGAEPLVINWTR